jgi:thioredoxin-dependent peroxiredoxin
MSKLKIGSLAPAFSLLNQDGEKVSLKDFLGSYVVVYFYPKAMTPGCTTQACGLRDSSKDLKKNKIVILGISPDAPSKLKKFEEKEKLNFTLLSDEDHAVASKYHSWGKKQFMGKTYDGILRQSFFIGKDGKLLHVMEKVNTKTHHDDVLEFFSKL